MLNATTVTTSGTVLAADGDTINFDPPVVSNNNLVGQKFILNLSSTPTTVNLPTNTVWFSVRPLPNNGVPNSVEFWLKGETGDSSSLAPHPVFGLPCFPVNASMTSFVLVAESDMSVEITSG